MRRHQGDDRIADWHVAATAPGVAAHPNALDRAPLVLPWRPFTTNGALESALGGVSGQPIPAPAVDELDWWFRASIQISAEGGALRFEGLATLATVWLDGVEVLHSDNMYLRHHIAVRPTERSDVVVCCRALSSHPRPKGPRARWRTALVSDPALRWVRTTFLGRVAGAWPQVPPIGLWRPVHLLGGDRVHVVRHRVHLGGAMLHVEADVQGHGPAHLAIGAGGTRFEVGERELPTALELDLEVPSAGSWSPATHGPRELVDVRLEVAHPTGVTERIRMARVASRTVEFDWAGAAALRVNGVEVFCRGAVWTPLVPGGPRSDLERLRVELERLGARGLNMLRVAGTGVYESPAFYDICDELGIMVWQDLMLARLDYPSDDARWLASLRLEIEQLADMISSHPSVVVVCGGSEVEQQASMLGLPSDVWTDRFSRDVLREWVQELLPQCAYVPNSPVGGTFPFAANAGVSHYYGVGAYRRPLDDARRARVRFASECLAFSAIPEDETLEKAAGLHEGRPVGQSWKRAVPRDPRSDWDFEDVRDHYVGELFGCDPGALRTADPARYLDLGRAALAFVSEATIDEWRRPQSTCTGALVLALRDATIGPGFGVIDSTGRPKSSFYGLARAAAPRGLLMVDEGLNGLECHVVNDLEEAFAGTVRIRLFDVDSRLVVDVQPAVSVGPASSRSFVVDGALPGFRDVTHAYRFGPRHVDVVVADLVDQDGQCLATRHFLPGGPHRDVRSDLDLVLSAQPAAEDVLLTVVANRLATFVCLSSGPFVPEDNWFHLAPGEERTVRCTPTPALDDASSAGQRATSWSGVASARAVNGSRSSVVRVFS